MYKIRDVQMCVRIQLFRTLQELLFLVIILALLDSFNVNMIRFIILNIIMQRIYLGIKGRILYNALREGEDGGMRPHKHKTAKLFQFFKLQ